MTSQRTADLGGGATFYDCRVEVERVERPAPSDYHDALTQLPNRRLFDDRLKQALHVAERRQSGVALMLVSLAGFSPLPDDAVREAARRPRRRACARPTRWRAGARRNSRCS